MVKKQFRRLKQRFQNEKRRRRLSHLVLGNPIDDPLDVFGSSSYALLEGVPTSRTSDRNSSNKSSSSSNSGNNSTPPDSMTSTPTAIKQKEGYAFDSIVVEALDGKLYHSDNDDDQWLFSVSFSKWNDFSFGNGEDRSDDGASSDDGLASEDDDEEDEYDHDDAAVLMKVPKADGSGDAWFRMHTADHGVESDPIRDASHLHPWEELKPLLREGANPVAFCCLHHPSSGTELLDETHLDGVPISTTTTTLQFARASIWLWKASDRVVISDIDGTITKSNARGVLGTILTSNFELVSHAGVCHLLHKLARKPSSSKTTTRVVYLTSRPIHLANKTRSFLSGLTQQQQPTKEKESSPETCPSPAVGLPPGPLLGFGGNLAKVLAMEVLSKTTQAFKAGQLEKHIAGPIRRARTSTPVTVQDPQDETTGTKSKDNNRDIFVAAFGNNLNDVQAYHKIGVDLDKIFMIDKNSEIVTFDKKASGEREPEQETDGFPPHSWYLYRIWTVFEKGYSDTKLHSFLGVDDDE